MSQLDSYLRYWQGDRSQLGRGVAIFLSCLLHFGAIGVLVFFGRHEPKVEVPLNSVPVSLAQRPKVNTRGRQRKSPVAGRERRRTPAKKAVTPPKKVVKKPPKNSSQLGLKREKPKKKPPKANASSKPVAKVPEKVADPLPQPPEDETVPVGAGGTGGEDDAGITFEVGNPNAKLDVKDIEFLSYYRLIQDQIGRRWSKGSLTGGMATVRFHIMRSGSIKDATVTRSAGKAYLDGPALRAVMGAELPPLPQGFREDMMIVKINFHYGRQ